MVEERLNATPTQVKRWRGLLADERAEAGFYRTLAARHEGEDREILSAIADAEERHISHWADLLGDEAGEVGRGSYRLRLLGWLSRWFGSVFILALAQRAETRSPYSVDPDATPAMAADERVHEEVLRGLAARGRARVSGTFRAAVFGANDGLVSNLALILGVSAGGVAPEVVLLTGIAGLLAGALSMAAGEYISIRSQRELLEASEPSSDAARVLPDLDVDANELALVYRARGMPAAAAQAHADEVLAGSSQSLEHPGGGEANGEDIVGSARGAAMWSFLSFGLGAMVPILPFLFGLTGIAALALGIVLAGAALLTTGAISGILSGGPPLLRGLRQLGIGAAAALITYLLGLAVGVTLG
ncbi:VIT1/CCC1 transporter family protein [Tomitella biformata]|uniref:VIT1/CCC1 transporter family protein n=1 Tax=Tomitella biformata TaxID=630403 RepID=UPI000462F174|nr:VIT1/CCC1 family protein [Tomitella biformata]